LWSELKVKIAMNQKIVLEEIPIDYNASRGWINDKMKL
jgi:hypothetical protein